MVDVSDIPTRDVSDFSNPQVRPAYNELMEGQKKDWYHFHTTRTTRKEVGLVEYVAKHFEDTKQTAFGVLTLAGFEEVYPAIKDYNHDALKEAINIININKESPYELYHPEYGLGINSAQKLLQAHVPSRFSGMLATVAGDVGVELVSFWRVCLCVSPLNYDDFRRKVGRNVRKELPSSYTKFGGEVRENFLKQVSSNYERDKTQLKMLWREEVNKGHEDYDEIKKNVKEVLGDEIAEEKK